MSRIFISHSSANNAAALALTSWLDAKGWSDYFLDIDASRGIAPGERWMAALAGAVDRCEAVIFLVSPAWRDSKFCFAEFFEAKKLGKRIFGVIVEPIPLSQLPEQMTAEWQVCDLTSGLDPVSFTVSRQPILAETMVSFPRAALDALARGLQNAGLDPSTFVWPPEGQPDRPPYPGLRALEEADAAVFFGREAAIVRAIDQMRLLRERDVEQLFVVLGASGAGKSSFLRAGLLPRLRRDAEHFVVLPPVRPERAAMSGSQGLLQCLKAALAAAGQPMSPAEVRADLAARGLAGVLARIGSAMLRPGRPQGQPEPTLIVPVDQAEELFGADGQEEARQFLDHLSALRQSVSPGAAPAAGGQRLRVLFVLTIRSDSLPRLQGQAALQAMSPVLFSLPAMPVSEFKAVIEGPAKRHSATVKPLVIAPQLTEQLVVDAQGADALPLLALTLEWLYREFTDARGTRIGYEEYQRLGGVRGVIGMAVERAFEQPGNAPAIPALKAEQERLLRQVFPYLATVDPDSGDWKRRVALRDVLRQRLPQGDALVSRLVEQRLLLADSRRMADGAEPVEVIEVAHEALLRQWDAMERWLRQFAAALAASESIRRSASDWQRSNRDEALLVHTAHRLQAAEALLADELLEGRFEAVDGEYLAACRARDRRALQEREEQLQRIAEQQAARATLQRRMLWFLSTAAVLVLGLAVWIVMQARAVSLQTSLVLTGAAEAAADEKRFDRSLRLGVLAARAGLLKQAHGTAPLVVARAADGSTLRTLLRHPNAVLAAFSPDAKHVVTASHDGTARVWDAETGEPVGAPMKLEGELVDLRFSDDGKQVVTSARAHASRIWEADTGKPSGDSSTADRTEFTRDGRYRLLVSGDEAHVVDTRTADGASQTLRHDGRVNEANFSADGTRVVTASQDTTARLWDAASGKPVVEPLKHREPVLTASFSEDGKRVVTVSGVEVRVWDTGTGQLAGEVITHARAVSTARLSDNGQRVVTASGDFARVWDAATGGLIGEPMAHDQTVRFASFSRDGKHVVTASDDGKAGVWDVDAGKLLFEHAARASPPAGVSPDGKRVVTLPDERTARVWDADTGKAVGEPMLHGSRVTAAGFSPDGKQLLTAAGSEVRVWQAQTGKPAGEPMRSAKTVASVGFSADGRFILAVLEDDALRISDVATSKPLCEIPGKRDEVPLAQILTAFDLSFDGSLLVTAWLNGSTVISDVRTCKFVGSIPDDSTITLARFSPNGTRLLTVAVGANRPARVWNTDTRASVGEPIPGADSAAFTPDGRRLVVSGDNTARVYDAETGKPIGEAMMHAGRVGLARFSPDGQRVVTGSLDTTARVWDAGTGKPVGEPMPHRNGLASVAFSSDGKRVATLSGSDVTRIWTAFWPSLLDPAALIAEVCQRKLRGNIRLISEADVRAARILAQDRVGEDVCEGGAGGVDTIELSAIAGLAYCAKCSAHLSATATKLPGRQLLQSVLRAGPA